MHPRLSKRSSRVDQRLGLILNILPTDDVTYRTVPYRRQTFRIETLRNQSDLAQV